MRVLGPFYLLAGTGLRGRPARPLGNNTCLEHRIRVRLIELELSQSLVRCLTHRKMLSGSKYIAVTALQRIRVEERPASSRLESYAGNTLRNLSNIRGGRPRLGLSRRWRSPTSLSLGVKVGHKLQSERTNGSTISALPSAN
jgi:hypothetical protein